MTLGYFIGRNQELIGIYLKQITVGLVLFVLTVVVGYIFYKKRDGEKKND